MNIKLLIFSAFLSLFLSFFLLSLFRQIARRLPKFSQNNVSFLGGLAFAIAALVSFAFYMRAAKLYVASDFVAALFFSFIILFVEFLDDLREFSVGRKVFIQSLVFLLFFALGGKTIRIYVFPAWLNYLLTFLWLMGITNAFNHLDIADGLCGGVGVVTALAFAVLAQFLGFLPASVFLLLLGSALSAFLIFNIHPAKVYMGNSGSHFLGFLFAALSMDLDYAGKAFPYLVIIPLLILAVPIIDTAFLLYIRPRKRILPFKKSDDHIFLRLLKKGISYRRALSLFYGMSLAYAGAAFLLYFYPLGGVLAAAALFVFTLFLLKHALFGGE